jgi:hypothetical protein
VYKIWWRDWCIPQSLSRGAKWVDALVRILVHLVTTRGIKIKRGISDRGSVLVANLLLRFSNVNDRAGIC